MGSARGSAHACRVEPSGRTTPLPTRLATLAERDEAPGRVVDDERRPYERLARSRSRRRALVHPVFFGSAMTGAGVDAVTDGIAELLPARARRRRRAGVGPGLQDRARPGRREDRLRAGVLGHRPDARPRAVRPRRRGEGDLDRRLRSRRRPSSARRSPPGRSGSSGGSRRSRSAMRSATRTRRRSTTSFAPPTLEAVVAPARRRRRARLRVALAQLAEQDPLIDVRQDDERDELSVSLYGEVQKEVIQATLARRLRPRRRLPRDDGDLRRAADPAPARRSRSCNTPTNPFRATIGLRVEPAPAGSGVEFRLDVDPRAVPLYLYKTADGFREPMGSTSRRTLRRACTAGRSPTAWSR